jgi:nucleoside 2-deoxyribosyltransferase
MMSKKIYIASKTKHADKWLSLRNNGLNIISTWIDEAGEGQTIDKADLCRRCICESKDCDIMLIYAEAGDILKGAFIEMGAAIAYNKPVVLIGPVLQNNSVFASYSFVSFAQSIDEAILFIAHSNNK